MTIYIAHLYYDLLNLYGEIGNVKAIKTALESQNIKVVISNLSINDNMDFNQFDLIYMGCGTESNQLLVLKDFIKYKNKVKEYIDNNKFFIATGNSYELFGKSIFDGDKHSALGIFDYNSKRQPNRIVGDVIVKCNFIDDKIIGFQNQGSTIKDNNNPMFEVSGSDKGEGIHYKNFYGTYLLGPILVRNPKLHEYILTNLIKSKDKKFKLKKFNFELDEQAYQLYMNNYHKEG